MLGVQTQRSYSPLNGGLFHLVRTVRPRQTEQLVEKNEFVGKFFRLLNLSPPYLCNRLILKNRASTQGGGGVPPDNFALIDSGDKTGAAESLRPFDAYRPFGYGAAVTTSWKA